MRFIVSSSTLLKELSTIHGVVSSNPTLPILENFLFEISENQLQVTASDLQTTMKLSLEVEAKDTGSIAIPARILIDTLKNLPEQPVTFSIEESSYSIEILSENGRYKLAGENATDFPQAPAVTNGYSLNLSSEILNKAISNTIIAASNDDLRPAMTGVLIQFNESSTTFVATDSHRLIKYQREDLTSSTQNSIIVPKKSLSILKSTLPGQNTNVSIEYNASNVFFKFDNLQMIARLIDERFPNYENVIPTDNENKITLEKDDLLNSLRRIAIYANKTTYQVRLKFVGSELQISAEDLNFSNEANERLNCEHEGEDIEIGFNAKFLIEILNNLQSKEITLTLSSPSRAGLIHPDGLEDGENILLLVMPVTLHSYA